MMRLARHAGLLVAFSLLVWTATAYAECALGVVAARNDVGQRCDR
jgi:hypothetical protein